MASKSRMNRRTWNIRVEGAEEVAKMLGEMATVAEEILSDASKAGAEIVLAEAKNRVPIDTGKLRDALELKKEKPRKKGKASWQVRTKAKNIKYAYAVEFGHKTKNGTHVKAQPYLRPAIEENSNKIKNVINSAIVAGLEGVR